MKQYPVFNIHVDICPECSGVWFDGDELGRITRGFELGTWPEIFKEWQDKQHDGTRLKLFEEDKLECPRDRYKMGKHHYAGDLDIIIDQCHICDGFWIDSGEVRKIWEHNRPNESLDGMAEGLYEVMTYSDRLEAEIQKKVASFAMLVMSPQNFGLYVLVQIIRKVINDLIVDTKSEV